MAPIIFEKTHKYKLVLQDGKKSFSIVGIPVRNESEGVVIFRFTEPVKSYLKCIKVTDLGEYNAHT